MLISLIFCRCSSIIAFAAARPVELPMMIKNLFSSSSLRLYRILTPHAISTFWTFAPLTPSTARTCVRSFTSTSAIFSSS